MPYTGGMVEPFYDDGPDDAPALRALTEQPRRFVRLEDLDRPRVVCLCGSMRFYSDMLRVAATETAAGRIVLAPFSVVEPGEQDSPLKVMLDRLHKRKIDMADEILVVAPGGYAGASTQSEIAYAAEHGTPIRWWPNVCHDCGDDGTPCRDCADGVA